MSKTIDTTYRISFQVGEDVFKTLYQRAADADLGDDVMSSNNQLGSYVRLRLLTDPADADVSGWEVDNLSWESSRTIALHVPEEQFQALKEAFNESDMSEDPRGQNSKYRNNNMSERLRRLAVSRMA
jgi:arabinogalactan endo-1,4-beta-galactosidase